MELKVKILKWSAGVPVVMLDENTAAKIGVHVRDRVNIQTFSKAPKNLSIIVDTMGSLVKENEIAVSSEVKQMLDLKVGQTVDVNLAPNPQSLNFIKEKMNGKELSEKKINEIIRDVMSNSLTEAEIALFVSAVYEQGMSIKEIVAMTKSFIESGKMFSLKNKFVVDKHSIGGIPGNRTTPIVVPICVAAGLIMPKNSSRAITSAAGTADVIETLADVEFSMDELKKIIQKTGGCMVWGGAIGLVPADAKIIQIEKTLNIDPEAMLLASIMSKKLAVGSKFILIDIPYGKTAKVSRQKALALKKKFELIARYFKRKMKVVLTNGSQPIGNGIGPALEMIDVIKVLRSRGNGEDVPHDLRKKAFTLAAEILEMTGKAKKGKGFEMAEYLVYSGKAYAKFKEIIEAQHGKIQELKPSKFKKDIFSKTSGKICEIDNKKINELAREAGCPADKFSGLYLYHHVGEKISLGEKLLTIYSDSHSRLNQAVNFWKKSKPIVIC